MIRILPSRPSTAITFLIAFFAFTQVNAQWATGHLTDPRSGLSAASTGFQALFAGGFDNTSNGAADFVDIYNDSSKTWSTTHLSVGRGYMAATAAGTKVFFAGGTGNIVSNVVDIYDTWKKKWTTRTLSQARYNLSAGAVGGKVFFAGGRDNSTIYATVDIYDINTDTWTTASLSLARGQMACTVVGSKIFFAGGTTNTGTTNVVDIYDVNTNAWTTSALSVARSNVVGVSAAGLAFFAGGYWTGVSDVIDVYDPVTNTWSTLHFSQGRTDFAAATDGTSLYFAGGSVPATQSLVDIYNTSTKVWSTATLSKGRYNFAAAATVNNLIFAGGQDLSSQYSDVIDIDVQADMGQYYPEGLPPVVDGITPTIGLVNSIVNLRGTGFSNVPAENKVSFGGALATVVSASTTTLTVKVPPNAMNDFVTVTVNNRTAYAPGYFTILSTVIPDFQDLFQTTDIELPGPANAGEWSVVLADLDGDGKSDIATIMEHGTQNKSICVWQNKSTGTGTLSLGSFGPRQDFPAPDNSYDITYGDVNGDGKLDLVTANYRDNSISIFKNISSPGSIAFAPQIRVPSGTLATGIKVHDLDGDGRPDLAFTNSQDNTLSIVKNLSTIDVIAFGARVSYNTGSYPVQLVIGDLDHDTKPDIVVSNTNEYFVSVFRNTGSAGTISFAPKVDVSLTAMPWGLSLADLDGDGFLDITVGMGLVPLVSILGNHSSPGTISFTTVYGIITTMQNPWMVSTIDLNGNGKLDLAVGFGVDTGSVSIFENISTAGHFEFAKSNLNYPTGGQPSGIALGDLDGDGFAEIVTGNRIGNNVSVIPHKLVQTINFPDIPGKRYGDGPFSLFASSATGLPISFSVPDVSVLSINGAVATINNAGTTTITAKAQGNLIYSPTPLTRSYTVDKAVPILTWSNPAAIVYGTALSATQLNASTPVPGSFIYTPAAGAVLTAGQGHNLSTTFTPTNLNNYSAISASVTIDVSKANQTIIFPDINGKTFGDAPFTLPGTVASGLPITYVATNNDVTIAGSQATLLAAGRASITASQNGDDNYNAAVSVNQTFCIKPATPLITISQDNTPSPTLASSATGGNQWYLNGTPIDGQTGTTLAITDVGIYTVTVQADDCVSDASDSFQIVITGERPRSSATVEVYPNPTERYIEVRGIAGAVDKITLFDMHGAASAFEMETAGDVLRASTEHLVSGAYVLRVKAGAAFYTVKFLKK